MSCGGWSIQYSTPSIWGGICCLHCTTWQERGGAVGYEKWGGGGERGKIKEIWTRAEELDISRDPSKIINGRHKRWSGQHMHSSPPKEFIQKRMGNKERRGMKKGERACEKKSLGRRSSNDYQVRSTLQRKSHLCIYWKGIARTQSKFQHSCVCDRLICSQDQYTYFPAAE